MAVPSTVPTSSGCSNTPVFTLGQAGKPEHVLNAGDIPVVSSDRGGQVTYHGPGQTVVYLMLDIKRLGLGSRGLVSAIEQGIIDFLASHGINAANRDDAPGVYVNGAKIASLGLRIRREPATMAWPSTGTWICRPGSASTPAAMWANP